MKSIYIAPIAAAAAVFALGACSPRDREEVKTSAQNSAAEVRQSADKAASKSAVVVEDTVITAKVKSALLADTTVKGLKIEVDTTGGMVTLTGKAASAAESSQAERLAAAVEGVRGVMNRISVS